MKTQSKMPKARVLYAHPESIGPEFGSVLFNQKTDFGTTMPCAVIPCRTRKQAAALVAWSRLTREDKVERIALANVNDDRKRVGMNPVPSLDQLMEPEPYRITANAILNLMEPAK